MKHSKFVNVIIRAAARHGRQSDPDHEVGDLQDALRACWAKLSPSLQREVARQMSQPDSNVAYYCEPQDEKTIAHYELS